MINISEVFKKAFHRKVTVILLWIVFTVALLFQIFLVNEQNIKQKALLQLEIQHVLENVISKVERYTNVPFTTNNNVLINPKMIDSLFSNAFLLNGLNIHYNFELQRILPEQSYYELAKQFNKVKGTFYGFISFNKMNSWVLKLSIVHDFDFYTDRTNLLNALFLLVTLSTFIAFYFLINNYQQQDKLNALRVNLMNNVTHELKTPIATIKLASEAIAENSENYDLVFRYSKKINVEIDRLEMRVDDILRSSAKSNNEVYHLQEIDLHKVVLDAVEQNTMRLNKMDAQLLNKLEAKLHNISGNYDDLVDVFNNLIDNAIKYASEKTLRISISSSNIQNGIQIIFSDNGIGIDIENINKIFERFYRTQNQDTHNVKGFGLGLSFVKQVMNNHFGTITPISEIEGGTTFILFFPFNNPLQI